jgi:hypothetical protein
LSLERLEERTLLAVIFSENFDGVTARHCRPAGLRLPAESGHRFGQRRLWPVIRRPMRRSSPGQTSRPKARS